MNPHLTQHHREWADLLKTVHEEVLALLFVRYVFGTVQEIFRQNKQLHSVTPIFSRWTQIVYGCTNGSTIRRLASPSFKKDDANLVRLFDSMCAHPRELVSKFRRHFPDDLAEQKIALQARHSSNRDLDDEACKRLIGEDRRQLIATAKTITDWTSKRVAHRNATVQIAAQYRDLQLSTDIVKRVTEKYLLLVNDRTYDLQLEMKTRKLRHGWDQLFLKKWATKEILSLPLGDMQPPEE